ncbi:MAG: sensor histidine kinase [Phycisphaerae bacterium]
MTSNAQSDVTRVGATPDVTPTAAAILDSLEQAVLITDASGVIKYRNSAADGPLRRGGTLATVVRDSEVVTTFNGWDVELARVLCSNTPRQFGAALDIGTKTPARLVTVRCAPLRSGDAAQSAAVVVTVSPCHERAPLEDQFEVSRRLASLGKLATRVAHELNNPLDAILRYINLAMRVADNVPEPKLQSYLAESRIGALRMVQIIGDLLDFSRSTSGEFDETDINELVDQAVRNYSTAAEAAGVVVAVDFQTPDMPAAPGSRLYQVCCNLIKNAIEAMPDGGRLTITTGIVNRDVVIRVGDTGVGLPTQIEKVFQPFFTTKALGQGTGLGLAICKDFVEDMKGTILAERAPGGGSVFTVRIPLSSFRRRVQTAMSPHSEQAGRVDDVAKLRDAHE